MADDPLLTKDAINLGGHKFPIPLIAGVAAILGVLILLRARKSGGQVAAGAAPNTGVNPAIDYGFGSVGPDYGAALANLNAQLTALRPQPTPTPPAPPPPTFAVTSALAPNQPVWLHASPSDESPVAAFLPAGQTLRSAGAPVTGSSFTNVGITGNQWEPIDVGGSTYYAFLPEVNVQPR